MGISIKSIEHGVAVVAHEILVGAQAVEKVVDQVEKCAPQVEAITSLIDPRAVVIERIGAALIGELQPQLEKSTGIAETLTQEAATPSFALSADLVTELNALYASLKSEIAGVKATVSASQSATAAASAPALATGS